MIINGPNLNLLGNRETAIYGTRSFEDFLTELRQDVEVEIDYFQSNIEGELIDALQQFSGDGIIFNAGGYTHTSVALHDCIKAISTPLVEVHISNLAVRESFRHVSYIAPAAIGSIMGFGLDSYKLAVSYFLNKR